MKKKKSLERSLDSLAKLFSSPIMSILAQIHPLSAGIVTFLTQYYSQEQYNSIQDFLHIIHERVRVIESRFIDEKFIETKEGKRILGKVFKSIVRDNREEKLSAMANLTVNIHFKTVLSFDEKELYVDILDQLNSLQLSILQKWALQIKKRKAKAKDKSHSRGVGWESLKDRYESKGFSSALITQSIRVLVSNGLVNENDATIVDKDNTHFLTGFGEMFYDFISDILDEESHY
ncbi:MAG: hypothetical protein KC414_15000, partial [Romboutsia sp.]|nr:hypothetical protein [Romboutsia sp.]